MKKKYDMGRKAEIKMVPDEIIMSKIYYIRRQKVMIDKDLASLYNVETKVLNQAVKRNIERFPQDFMFKLSAKEWESLRSHFVTLETGRGKHAKYIPVAFSEQGVAMLSSILKSDRAIAVNIQIIRIFTRIREILINHKEILDKLEKIEQKMNRHDEDIALIFGQLRRMLNPAKHSRRRIGFRRKGEND